MTLPGGKAVIPKNNLTIVGDSATYSSVQNWLPKLEITLSAIHFEYD